MLDILGAQARLRGLQGVSSDGTRLVAGSIVRFETGAKIRVVRKSQQQPDYYADVTLTSDLLSRSDSEVDVHASGMGYANDDPMYLTATGLATSTIDADNLAAPVLEGTSFYVRPKDVLVAAVNTDFLLADPSAAPASDASPPTVPVPAPPSADTAVEQQAPSTTGWSTGKTLGVLLLVIAGVSFTGWAITR